MVSGWKILNFLCSGCQGQPKSPLHSCESPEQMLQQFLHTQFPGAFRWAEAGAAALEQEQLRELWVTSFLSSQHIPPAPAALCHPASLPPVLLSSPDQTRLPPGQSSGLFLSR